MSAPASSNDNAQPDAWLDAIVASQAAYYGLPVDRFAAAMHNLAVLQEMAEADDELFLQINKD